MKTKHYLIALLAVFALLAASCGGGEDDPTAESDESATETGAGEDEAEPDESDSEGEMDEESGAGGEAGSGGNLRLLQWQAPSQANSLLSGGTKDLLAGSLVLEPLAEFGPDGGLVPLLATEVPSAGNGISDDLTSITWTLRDDVLWSDGTPFTADDVVFTWEYCADEATGCSTKAFADVESVVADDDHTVTVTFNEAKPYPFEPFVSANTPIVQRAQMEECKGDAAKACSDQNFMPVGTGPYMVTELRPEDTVTYAMNPNYRGVAEGKPFFGTVELKGGGDAESAARSVLEVGEADYAWNLQVAPEILTSMEEAGVGRAVFAFTNSVEHISLNQTDPFADPPSTVANPHPLFVDNPDLHRALSIAINRDELVTVGYGPTGRPTCNIWPVGAQNSTNNDWCLSQNIEEANALLDGLGYDDTDGDGVREAPGFGPLEFDYVTSTNAVRQSNQELIAVHWEQIGVKANMRHEDAGLFFDGTCASEVCIWKFFTPIQMYTNSSPSPYPGVYLNGYRSDKIPSAENSWGGDNIYRINSAEVDALIDEMLATPVDDSRLDEVTIELNDKVSTTAIIPLIHRASVSAFSNKIENTGDLNGWDSEYWNIEEWTRSE